MKLKNALIMISVVLLATDAWAIFRHQRGYKNGDAAKRITADGAAEIKEKGAAEKNVRAKAKELSETKIEIPADATYEGCPIDASVRIMSLCGFEIGEIAKVPRHPVLDDDGNIIMTGKLAKPFRKCTQYEIKYSNVNHALYSIRVFSYGQKKMDDDAAAAELEAMAAAVKSKFGDKITSWIKKPTWINGATATVYSQMHLFSYQRLAVASFKDYIGKKALKGTAEHTEKGWAFSLTLTDRYMHDYVAEKPADSNEEPEGVDAL